MPSSYYDERMSLDDLKARAEFDLNTRYTDEYLTIKLAEALALVDAKVPAAATRLASGELSSVNFMRVIADMVFRVIRNPGGYASESEGGASYTLRATVASGDLWLTANDVELLTGRSANAVAFPSSVSIGVDAGWQR